MVDYHRPQNGRHSADEWLLALVQQTVVSLLDEREKRYSERFEAQKEAIRKVDEATEKRFEGVNEFRKAMTDRDVLYMPRAEAASQYQGLIEKMESHGREDVGSHTVINKRIEEIGKRVDNFDGTVSGSRMTLITIGGLATFLVAVIVIGTFIFNSKTAPPPTPAPQVIYVPAPAGSLLPTTPPQPAPR